MGARVPERKGQVVFSNRIDSVEAGNIYIRFVDGPKTELLQPSVTRPLSY